MFIGDRVHLNGEITLDSESDSDGDVEATDKSRTDLNLRDPWSLLNARLTIIVGSGFTPSPSFPHNVTKDILIRDAMWKNSERKERSDANSILETRGSNCSQIYN